MSLSIVAWICAAQLGAAAATVECTDPATGDKKTIAVAKVQAGVKGARQRLQKLRVHVLDLPQAVQERHRNLAQFTSEKNWCAVYAHVVAIEDALRGLRVDRVFVSDKFSRVERWARAGGAPERRAEVERLLAVAAAQLEDQRFEKANDLLNRAMTALFSFAAFDGWRLPQELPVAEATDEGGGGGSGITRAEVQAGCPGLAKQGTASRADLDGARERLGRQLDKRRLRPLDLAGGEALFADLGSYVKLNAWWPAVRVVCALTERAAKAEIDLGLVSKRFQRVKNLHERRPFDEAGEARFRALVRDASQSIIDKRFEEAHLHLDELLVLLGEPAQPSAALD